MSLASPARPPACLLITGDDTYVQAMPDAASGPEAPAAAPGCWATLVQQRFAADPQLMLLVLRDAADPGFPSFPVLRASKHLELFEDVLPSCFLEAGINQGASGGRGWCRCLRPLARAAGLSAAAAVLRIATHGSSGAHSLRWLFVQRLSAPGAVGMRCRAGGDPYLQDLYSGASGAAQYCPRVEVHNAVGGVQLAGQAYVEPRC